MNGQVLRTVDAAPTIELFFFSTATGTPGAPVTTLTNATSGLTISYRRGIAALANITLAAQTSTGAWVAGGFVHLGGGLYRLDLPVAANASGVTDVTVFASALPTDVACNPIVIGLTPDDLTVAGPTEASIASAVAAPSAATIAAAVAAPSAATIAAQVWAAGTRELTGISVAIREAFADTLLGRTVTGGANGGRTVARFFLKGVARWLRSGVNNTTLTQYGIDDVTPSFTEVLTLDSNGTVIGSDPT